MTIAHLIGNGPSKQYFQNTPIGDIFGCNFGSDDIDFKAVFIHDLKPFKHILETNMKFPWPIIVRNKHHNVALKCVKQGCFTSDMLSVLPGNINEKSSGHDGLLYLLHFGSQTYDEVHLWGFDSLVSGIVNSDSKHKIRGSCPNPSRIPIWKKRFNAIFVHAKKVGKRVFLHHNADRIVQVA